MHDITVAKVMSSMGKKGGRARAKKLSASRRQEIAGMGGLAKAAARKLRLSQAASK